MTFAEYILLSDDDQAPIDEIVKERAVRQLMIKYLLNKQLREHLVQTFSVDNSTCYPNTISDAISLLTTFNKGDDASNRSNDNVSKEEAYVAYHETLTDDNDDTDTIVDDTIKQDEAGITINDDIEPTDIGNNMTEPVDEEDIPHVTFNESVMATIIAEATAEADQNQFIVASFGQLQEVNSFHIMVVILRPTFGVIFLKGHISLKN
jgi:hypothetical protein